MHDFRYLHKYYNASPVAGSAADYVRTKAFLEDVERLEQEPKELARLTLGMLKHLALDPSIGDCVEKFVSISDESIWFQLTFHRFTNIAGWFRLPRNTVESDQLLGAIQQNLESRRFKAANLCRRLDKKFQMRVSKLRRRADSFGQRHRAEIALLVAKSPPPRYLDPDSTAARAAREVARQAYEAIWQEAFGPTIRHLEGRMRAVELATFAFEPEFLGDSGFYSLVAEFAFKYIRPQPELVCD